MDDPQTLGERLRGAMRRRGLRNGDVAKVAGVHHTTVSKWLSDKQVPDAEALDRVAALVGRSASWLRYGRETPPIDYSDRVPSLPALTGELKGTVREPTPAGMPTSYPQRVRALIREFEAEATNAGATEWEIDFCRSVLTSPAASVMYQGGRPRQLTEEEWLTEVSALIVGLRAWLKERIKRRQAGTA